ncbi:MAG: ATP-dependent Clp protease ATP-binding subunit [Clostridia bacterium]|nr:ATP-dependent Clp protease ATP-binding subunit [Clostridia bacterium]
MKNKFTKRAENALKCAKEVAEELGHTYIGSEHVLVGLVSERGSVASKLLEARGADRKTLMDILRTTTGKGVTAELHSDDMSPRTRKIVSEAGKLADRLGFPAIGTEHVLCSVLNESDSSAVRLLVDCSISVKELKNDLSVFFGAVEEMRDDPKADERPRQSVKRSSHSALSTYGKDLTAEALCESRDPVIGREKEIERVIKILSRKTKNNPILIGEPGVGKTAIAEGLASAIASRSVPDSLYGKQIFSVDLSSMIAGAKYRGEFEERLRSVINEAKKDRDVILFIDEIHTIIGAGSAEGAMDAANILKPSLARGEIRVIGATTVSEYSRHIERDAALERRFQPVRIFEPSESEAVRMLNGLKKTLEDHHGIRIEDEVIPEAVRLSIEHVPDRYLPDKAIDLLDEAASDLKLHAFSEPKEIPVLREELKDLRLRKEKLIFEGELEKAESLRSEELIKSKELLTMRTSWERKKHTQVPVLGIRELRRSVSEQTGVDITDIDENEGEQLSVLADQLKKEIFGQDEACEKLAAAVVRARIGIRDKSRPVGSFIFCGPSGVGKTALAKELSKLLYGKEAYIKFDMSEYSEKHSISKLIGSPPGYVGYDEPGKLTDWVRSRPRSIVVFDEIDKSHPDIYGLLLQILDDGVLTDSKGKKAHFSNCIIIITANLPSNDRRIGFEVSNNGSERRVAEGLFRPEIVNRFDEIIRFNMLDHVAATKIAQNAVNAINVGLEKLGYEVEYGNELIDFVVGSSDYRHYGARAILRKVKTTVEDALSKAIVEKKIKKTERYVISVLDNGDIVIKNADTARV